MAKSVIIVDDSKTIIATAEMALEDMVKEGVIDFRAYTNPKELLENLQSGTVDFDLLICDINMPQMNGLDLSAEIKKDR